MKNFIHALLFVFLRAFSQKNFITVAGAISLARSGLSEVIIFAPRGDMILPDLS